MGVDANFYDYDYFENGVASGKSGYQGYRNDAGIVRIAEDLNRYFKPRTALDLGCAKGFLVKELRNLGVEAYGVDISEYAIENAPDDIKRYVWQGSCLDLSRLMDGSIDLIICYDILEHITDEELTKALPEIMRVLGSGKFLTMKCPFERYDWDLDKSHINIKPQSEWIKLFSKYGFENYNPTAPKNPWTWNDNRTLFFRKQD